LDIASYNLDADLLLAKQTGIPTLYRSRLVWDFHARETRIPPVHNLKAML